MPQNIAPDSSHIDQWMWVLVSAKHQIGGSQDHLVCLHLLAILADQSRISKVILTLGTKMRKKHDYDLVRGNTKHYIIQKTFEKWFIILCQGYYC